MTPARTPRRSTRPAPSRVTVSHQPVQTRAAFKNLLAEFSQRFLERFPCRCTTPTPDRVREPLEDFFVRFLRVRASVAGHPNAVRCVVQRHPDLVEQVFERGDRGPTCPRSSSCSSRYEPCPLPLAPWPSSRILRDAVGVDVRAHERTAVRERTARSHLTRSACHRVSGVGAANRERMGHAASRWRRRTLAFAFGRVGAEQRRLAAVWGSAPAPRSAAASVGRTCSVVVGPSCSVAREADLSVACVAACSSRLSFAAVQEPRTAR
jgi:hypothetical protein